MCSVIFIIITVWMFYNQNRHGSPWLVIQADILCISSSPPPLLLLSSLLLLLLLRLLWLLFYGCFTTKTGMICPH